MTITMPRNLSWSAVGSLLALLVAIVVQSERIQTSISALSGSVNLLTATVARLDLAIDENENSIEEHDDRIKSLEFILEDTRPRDVKEEVESLRAYLEKRLEQ